MARGLLPDEERPFRDHIRELRNRLLWWLGFLALFCLVAFHFHLFLEGLIIRPIHTKLYYTSPAGGVDFLFKIVIGFGLIPSLPILIYQLIRFLTPAVPESVAKSLPKVIFFSIILTLLSVAFAYVVGLPIVFKFFNTFTNPQVQALITTNEYASFVINYLVLFAVLFQLPLALIIINKVFPINVRKLNRFQPYILIAFFLLAGIITPTFEPRSQLTTALPMIVLFELAVLKIYLTNRSRRALSQPQQALLEQADAYYRVGQLREAERLYQQVHRQASWSAGPLLALGKVYIKAERFDQAVAALGQAVKKEPTNASAQANLGISYLGLKNYRAAMIAFEAALKLRPDNQKYQDWLNRAREKF